MSSATATLDQRFQALGDATRRAVVQRLCAGPATVSALAAPFDMALPSFVQHLGLLERCGLISTAKEGRVRTCRLNADALQETEEWLGKQRALWVRRLDQLDGYLMELKPKEKKP
jgi:DNA-binding transcriptional ArsR family regulator